MHDWQTLACTCISVRTCALITSNGRAKCRQQQHVQALAYGLPDKDQLGKKPWHEPSSEAHNVIAAT